MVWTQAPCQFLQPPYVTCPLHNVSLRLPQLSATNENLLVSVLNIQTITERGKEVARHWITLAKKIQSLQTMLRDTEKG